MNMQNLMAQAQRMQREITAKKEEINKQTFTGKSELVDVIVSGNKIIESVIIKNKDLTADDMEILEDSIKIAVNDAMEQIDKATNEALGKYGSSLNGLL